jgi:hypothetical protein
MEHLELAEENLQDVTGGLDTKQKIIIGASGATAATAIVGVGALLLRKPGAAGAVQHAATPPAPNTLDYSGVWGPPVVQSR